MKKRQGVIERINYADVIIVFILIIFTLLALYPFVYTIAGSFNDGIDYEYGGIWLFPLRKAIDQTEAFTVAGVAGGLVFTSCVAYAMSHPKLKFHKVFWVINMITMFFGGGLIPYFMLIKGIGLYNSFLVYIIPSLYSVYNMIVLTNFFRGIDNSMRESAMLDGANEFRIWWSLYMPVSMPALATVGLWLTVGHWNSYMPTLIYTKKDESMWLLQFYEDNKGYKSARRGSVHFKRNKRKNHFVCGDSYFFVTYIFSLSVRCEVFHEGRYDRRG